ncbi:MAG: HlyC/CorC family transporter [Desulfobacterales bacterium]|jgi:putative hemolysin|nr:HlyC/CorC family transporter [Desulfobacteraceae bacterium]MBT7086161.1 HlyC/CorC family transporter [Desulfobacterales bacterium]MBT7696526.1 HlyC/CorC family transporter [Desulfobacterales bacterium]
MNITEQPLILLGFIFLSAFFSATETAFMSLSDIRVQHLLEQKKRGMKLVKRLKDNNRRLVITILIGNNLVNIAASAIATSIAIEVFESNALGIAVGIMTVIILVFGEIIPKNIAILKNEALSITAAPVIRILQYTLLPVIIMLEWITRLVSIPFEKTNQPIITEAEIKSVVSLGEEVGEVEKDEKIMIHNIFRFSDLQVSEIMVDRTQIYCIDSHTLLNDVTTEITNKGFSRIPIYEETKDNIIGILYAKDILKSIFSGGEDTEVSKIVRPAMFIPESMHIDDLLKEFQKKKIHIAMVADEHGGISGLITFEDLLEQIVGDIYDETDLEQRQIRKIDENKSIVKGETEIEEVNKTLDLDLNEKENYETISGFILAQLRRIPEYGDELKIKNHTIRITKADEKQIIEVEIEKD